MSDGKTANCGVCDRVRRIEEATNPYFVAELESGYVVMGDHQLFRGYALLLCKEHKTGLHQLGAESKRAFLEEMSILAEAVFKAFRPRKLNYELLGNSIEHMHWHIIPRHEDDPRPIGPVWVLDRGIRYAESTRPSEDELLRLKTSLLNELTGLAKGRVLRVFSS
jgi:diadenosine tetraphosphate (Ap4A) HIT family hydrolase